MQLQAFDINGSAGCFYLQVVMVSVLVKIQDFTTNDSDRVCDGASMAVCF